MLNVVLYTVLKGVGIFILTLFLSRIVGTKLISQMNFFDFILGVSMGSIVASAIIDKDFTSISSITALITLAVLTILTAYLHIKSYRVKNIVDSEPITLVKNGVIVEKNMEKIRLTVNELMMKLREKNAFNLADVEFAIMEANGEVTVLPKADKKPLTPNDIKIKVTDAGLTKDIIIDGNVIKENLSAEGLDMNWLKLQLNSQNIKDKSEVFYAGLDNTKKLQISKKALK